MSRGTAMSMSTSGRRPRCSMTSSMSSAPMSECGEAVEATTMSASSSRSGSSSRERTAPPKRSASARARPAWRLAMKIVVTPWSASACAVRSLVSPAPMTTTLRSARSPAGSRASLTAPAGRLTARQLDRDRRDADPLAADGGLRADALAGLERGPEQAVRQRPGRAGGERELVRPAPLALDLGFADDHRLEAARDAVELARGIAVARRVDDLGERGRADAGTGREARQRVGLGLHGVGRDEVQLEAVAGRDHDRLLQFLVAREVAQQPLGVALGGREPPAGPHRRRLLGDARGTH